MAKGKATTKRRSRPQPAINLDLTGEMQAMAKRAWKERGIVILWPEQIEDEHDRQFVGSVAEAAYGESAVSYFPKSVPVDELVEVKVDHIKNASDLIEEASAKLDSTLRFAIVMGDRLTAVDEAPIFYTVVNVLEPIKDAIDNAVRHLFNHRYPNRGVRGEDCGSDGS